MKYESQGGTWSKYGWPTSQVYVETKDDKTVRCQMFEDGNICELDDPTCEEGKVWDGKKCEDKKTYECEQKGLVKYVNPNNSKDITCAKINQAPYINQWLSGSGQQGSPQDGWMHCSAASSVMAAAGFGKIKQKDYTKLKEFVFLDKPFENEKIKLNKSLKSCPNLQGAFSYTALKGYCNQGAWENITLFLKQLGIKVSKYANRKGERELFYNDLKHVIDSEGLVIQGLYKDPDSHIVLIKGYTDDNLDGKADRAIVNDSYRNFSEQGKEYNFRGKGAIYNFDDKGILFNSYVNLSI